MGFDEIRLILELLTNLLNTIAWPGLVLGLVVVFRRQIGELLLGIQYVTFEASGRKVTVNRQRAADVTSTMLQEVNFLVRGISPRTKTSFLDLATRSSAPLVRDFFPGYQRKDSSGNATDELEMLRDLRRRQLIRPVGTNRWTPEGRIEVTPFGKLVFDVVGDRI